MTMKMEETVLYDYVVLRSNFVNISVCPTVCCKRIIMKFMNVRRINHAQIREHTFLKLWLLVSTFNWSILDYTCSYVFIIILHCFYRECFCYNETLE